MLDRSFFVDHQHHGLWVGSVMSKPTPTEVPLPTIPPPVEQATPPPVIQPVVASPVPVIPVITATTPPEQPPAHGRANEITYQGFWTDQYVQDPKSNGWICDQNKLI